MSYRVSRCPRRGALLPVVLAVMVLIGLAASAGLFMARGERTASVAAVLQALVISAADDAEVGALGALGPRAARLDVGEGVSGPISVGDSRVVASARLMRIGLTTFALGIDSRAVDAAGRAARRRASLLLRLDPAALRFPSALQLASADTAPSDVADGDDRRPSDWPCDTDSAPVLATTHPSPSAADSTTLGGLRERADLRLSAGAFVGSPGPAFRDEECDVAHPGNWGDIARTSSCARWLPIVHAPGDLTVAGGSGQGTLLVDGDLRVSGGFEFVGAVIVAGTLAIGPGGSRFTGGVRAGRVVDAGGISPGTPSILYSSCAVREALVAAGTLVRLADRPWALER